MSEARNEFIRATFQLSKSNPKEWIEFYDAFNAYTISELDRGTMTTTDDMAISLGMGRRMVQLRNDFREIELLAKKIGVIK